MATKIINGVVVALTQREIDAMAAERAAKLIPRAVKAKRAEILAQYRAATATIKAGYDADEMLSWPKQEAQARAFLADPEADVEFLHNLATMRGVTTQFLAERIMQKVAAHEEAFSTALGTRDRRLLELDSIDLEAPDALDLISNV